MLKLSAGSRKAVINKMIAYFIISNSDKNVCFMHAIHKKAEINFSLTYSNNEISLNLQIDEKDK